MKELFTDVGKVECEPHTRTGMRDWNCKVKTSQGDAETEVHRVYLNGTDTQLMDGNRIDIFSYYDGGECRVNNYGGRLELNCDNV